MAQTNGFTPLTPGQVQRYSRHLIMDGVGSVGQRKLIDAKVLIIGAGGLGSPIALYLALAGVGTLGIADFDTVDVSNLQRQIVHATSRIGEKLVDPGDPASAHIANSFSKNSITYIYLHNYQK